MTQRAAPATDLRRSRHIRVAGTAVLIALATLIWAETPWTTRARATWFDNFQALAPRQVQSMPATIVEIDQKSLAALGQWPWPRSLLAELVDAILRQQPAAVALDLLMPEADELSPERVMARARRKDAALAGALGGLPSNDADLARALAAGPTVVAVAGTAEPTGLSLRAAPFSIQDAGASATGASPAPPNVAHYRGALTSIDVLDRAAVGHGLISVDPDLGVIRRIPLVASIEGTLVPALTVELLRVAVHAPSLRLLVSGTSVNGVSIGDFTVPTEDDGAVRVYYSHRNAGRFVSAVDLLQGKIDPLRLQQKLVLIGVTGIGLIEYQNTPLGDRMPGSEIHAQLLENIFDQSLLQRPAWAKALETLIFAALGASLLWATPRWKPYHAGALLIVCIAVPLCVSFLVFRSQRLLFDAALPSLGLTSLFGVLLILSLAEATRQRKSLERMIQVQREQSARMAGELEAARRIQTASLPRADALKADARIDLDATMIAARETGGDLYDFFHLGPRRLFFLIGDVAGKGLSASIFMAVSKALYKSATLRTPDADMGELMSAANAEISRDNPELLFVTAFAGILDLESGDLVYCNAGHENPYLIDPVESTLGRIEDGDGPPLCAIDGHRYRGGRIRIRPGTVICLVTDGVTDAENTAGARYGGARLQQLLLGLGRSASARAVVDALRTDVLAFSAGAEPADDLTLLAFRWHGASGGNSGPVGMRI